MRRFYKWRLRVWEARLAAYEIKRTAFEQHPYESFLKTKSSIKGDINRHHAKAAYKAALLRLKLGVEIPTAKARLRVVNDA